MDRRLCRRGIAFGALALSLLTAGAALAASPKQEAAARPSPTATKTEAKSTRSGAKTAKGSTAKVKFAPIDYRHRTLSNGLEVYSVEDHSSPTVSIHVTYHVGSKDDPQHRSGFAHLFEHIMFKSTAHMPAEMMDRLTEDVGGFNNANTQDDSTNYYEVVPSNYLETLLWAEGERMGSLTVDEANFKSEREVVKEEFRFRILSPPYGRFYYAIETSSFTTHPYKRPGIGSMEDLDASTVSDVQAFHKLYYRPDNAYLIVVGDFEPKQLDAWVDQYLGPIEHPSAPIPRVSVKEPARTARKSVTEYGPNVELPAVAITWLAPAASSPDSYALNIAAAILAQGDSSRLYQSMIYRDQVAQQVDAQADLREDLGMFALTAVMASGHTPAQGETALLDEVKKLADVAVSAAELEKAKNQLLANLLRQRETNDGKAIALGDALVLNHDATEVNVALDRLERVTAGDVQRVMRKYVLEGQPVVINYLAESARPKPAAGPPPPPADPAAYPAPIGPAGGRQ